MNYELAKELKQNGFDQEPVNFHGTYYLDEELGGVVYMPTLSELIEACGDNFYSLYRHRGHKWEAYSSSDQWDTKISHGSTPEEAVARLWLSLNKK